MILALKICKRSLVLMLMICLIASVSTLYRANERTAEASGFLKIGDYVVFGSYLNQPILWRVISKDDDGDPLLFSDRILTLKPFDAGGSFHPEQIGDYMAFRDRNGSNFWKNSNLRQWLNSSEKSIKWWQNTPNGRNVWFEYNSYDKEKGFLADGNFTSSEREAIKPVTQQVLLSLLDRSKKDGGSESFRFREHISDVMQNYDKAYYQMLQESVFLLSVKQVKELLWDNRGILGNEFYFAKPTIQAVQASNYSNSDLSGEKNYPYWLSTPAANYHANEVTLISDMKRYSFGDILHGDPNRGYQGVRPALWLDLQKAFIKPSGLGTVSKPYLVFRGMDQRPPSVPNGLKMSSSTNNQISITWDAANDDFAVQGYQVYRDGNLSGTTETTSYTFNGLSDSTKFDVTVRSYDEAGNQSGFSQAVRVNTLDKTAPTQPLNVQVSNLTDTTVELSWNSSYDAFGVSNYEVYRGGSWYAAVKTNRLTVVNLKPEQVYTFRVVALDFSGNRSVDSDSITFKTLVRKPPELKPVEEIRVVGRTIYVNGSQLYLTSKQRPILLNGVLMIPYRPIFEALGYQVQWFPGNQLIKANKGNQDVRMLQGRTTIWIRGKASRLASPPTFISGSMMIPLRSLGENLQMKVSYVENQ